MRLHGEWDACTWFAGSGEWAEELHGKAYLHCYIITICSHGAECSVHGSSLQKQPSF